MARATSARNVNSGVTFVTYSPAFTGAANASGLTYFRIYGYNAANNGTNALLYVDNVTVGGCQSTPPPSIAKTFLTNPVAIGGSSTLLYRGARAVVRFAAWISFSSAPRKRERSRLVKPEL